MTNKGKFHDFPLFVSEKQEPMKKTTLLLGLMALLMSCNAQNPKEMNTERLTYFSFDHHNTMARFNGEKYQVSAEKDGRIHFIIDEGYPDEKDFYVDDTTVFDDLLAIVKQYKMDKYKSNYQPSMRIFDGDSWSLYYRYDTRRSVSSGGYMDWPDNYDEARQAINEYFQKWRDYAVETKRIDLFRYTSKNNSGCDIEYRIERGEEEATLTIRNAEYDTDKQLAVSNDYLNRLQELVNVYRLKDEYNRTTDDDSVTNYNYLVCYSNGDTLDIKGYYTTYLSGTGSAFESFFSHWLPVRGNIVRLEYLYRVADFREIKYYVTKEGEGFTLSYYDERREWHERKMGNEDMPRLQELVESFGLDKAKDEFKGNNTWFLFTDYDSGDSSRVGGRGDDEASKAKAQRIFEALTEFFAPYFK